jgi:hypothetical protein
VNRRGIALPMVILVMVALAILSSLALFDALQAWRVAALAEDSVRARAAAQGALAAAFRPPNLPLLCLQPPHLLVTGPPVLDSNGRAELGWRALGPGRVRAEVTGIGRAGARQRLLVLLAPDSLPTLAGTPGCPTATRLVPQGPVWVLRQPEG